MSARPILFFHVQVPDKVYLRTVRPRPRDKRRRAGRARNAMAEHPGDTLFSFQALAPPLPQSDIDLRPGGVKADQKA